MAKETKGRNRLIPLIVALLIIAPSVTSLVLYSKLQALQANPQAAVDEQVNELLTRVSELIDLPTDERPTVATVQDPEQLKDQMFFAKAKVGDKVLIFPLAKKAILYSPSEHRIIEVAPVNLGGAEPAPEVAGEALETSETPEPAPAL